MKRSLHILAALVAIALCRQTSAAIFNPNDVASLIAAINTSNTNGEDDTIELVANGTYTLTAVDNGQNGLPRISSDTGHTLVIQGNGATLQRSTAGGTPAFRILQIFLDADVTIDGLTITNGLSGGGGGIDNFGGTLTISNSTISGNSANGGGGIFNGGNIPGNATLTISNSTISGNSATVASGGGIFNDQGNTVTISNSTISGNSTSNGGGGIANASGGTLTITNSTFSGNSAGFGGGGIYNRQSATLTISDTVLNAGAAGANIGNEAGGTITSQGYNLSSDDGGGFLTGPGDQINTPPMLGPLQNNGGPTFTHALLVGSPAIDAAQPEFDQRGPEYLRVVNGRRDIGAFEVQPAPTPTPTATPQINHTPPPPIQRRIK